MLDMRLSARADYALRAAIELAAAQGDHVTADQLAKAQGIPGKFLEAILTQLGRSGLVRSRRGPDGDKLPAKGYDEGDTVTLLEVQGAWAHIRGDDGREGWVLAVTLVP
jgi:Rrf2 family protein